MSHVHVPGHQHDYPETFSNPPGSVERNFSWESLWFFPSRPFAQLFDQEVPEGFVIESDDAKAQFEDAEGKNSVTWIGHMSTVIRLDGRVILLDPWVYGLCITVTSFWAAPQNAAWAILGATASHRPRGCVS